MDQQKANLREQLKRQRNAMTHQQTLDASRAITRRALDAVDWSRVNNIHSYTPIFSQHEVDTTLLCEAIRQKHPNTKIATWEHTDGSLSSVWVTPYTVVGSKVPPSQQFDVIIVPLLGFNENRFRIGYGGGTYDRFLANQAHAFTIGLGYEIGHLTLEAFVPEPHDIALARIITEQAVYSS